MSWHPVPFVRLLLPLLLGIILYPFELLSFTFLGGLLILPLFLLLIGWFQKDPSMRAVRIWGAIATSSIVFLGYALSYQHDHRHVPHHATNTADSTATYIAILSTPPERKTKSMKSILQLKSIRQDSSWQPCSGKVLTYFKLDTASILLEYGQELLFKAHLKPIDPPNNPDAFNAQQYYAHQNIYQQCYLPRENWRALAWDGQYWQQQIYTWKNELLEILKETISTPNEYAVAAALLLGAKSGLDSQLKNAYADTGAMHVLAVSGLHIGILIAILSFFLRFLNYFGPKGKRLRALLLLIFLWLFALLTGASASVLRASTMFSLLLIGQVLGRSINIYNSLAASAFILLCIDTNLLYQVGFQLSYLALIGIVYLHPKIYALWKTEIRWKDWVWQGVAVSLAAQIATTPLSLYYFHQFPIFFWLSGLVVTALAGVLLGLGLALLLLAKVPVVGVLIAGLFEHLLFLMNTLIFGIQQLPGAVWEGFWLESWQLWLAYFILIATIICLRQRRLPWGIAALSGILIFVSFEAWQTIHLRQQAQLCIYNSRKSSAWTILAGNESFTWIDSTLLIGSKLAYLQKNHLCARGISSQKQFVLQSTWNGNFGQYTNGKGIFFGTRLALYGTEEVYLQSGAPLPVNYVLIHGNPRLYDMERIELLYNYQTLVFDGSNNRWNRKRWAAACDTLGIPYVDVVESGALIVNLR